MKPTIQLTHNGDPYGSGFVGSQSTDDGISWFYRGDIGARSRNFWRRYCQRLHITLREKE